MRVLLVLASTARRGAETFAVTLADQLAQRGVHAETVALAADDRATARLDVRVLGRSRMSLATLRRLRSEARSADVVVANGSTTLFACAVSLLGLGTPFVYVNIGDPRFWATTWWRRLRVSLSLSRATAIAALSPQAASSLAAMYQIPERRLRVIPNGRDHNRFTPAGPHTRESARRDLEATDAHCLVLVLGALSVEKRVDLAISAAARLPHVSLVVVGDGPLLPKLEAQARDKMPGRATFTGASRDPARYLAAADLVLLCSDSEGLPGVLIEAGLCALPTVATDVGFVRDIVIHGVTGYIAPAGDEQAIALAVDAALRHREPLGRRARAHCIEHFTLDAVADRWIELLDDVTAHRTCG